MLISLFPVHAFILLPTCGKVSHGCMLMLRILTHPCSPILLKRFLVLCRHSTLQQHSCNLGFICGHGSDVEGGNWENWRGGAVGSVAGINASTFRTEGEERERNGNGVRSRRGRGHDANAAIRYRSHDQKWSCAPWSKSVWAPKSDVPRYGEAAE